MRKIFLVIAVIFLAACSNQPPASTATKINVAGGSYTNVTPAELNQMLAAKDFTLINVHIPYAGELAKTDAFIPFDQVAQNLSKFPTDKNAKIVLYCQSGNMSTTASQTLVKLGYTNVFNLDGGMSAWESAGLPLIRK